MYAIEETFVEATTGALHVSDLHSFGGDVLVTRRGGSAGSRRNQREALRSLRLKHLDDVCVVEARKGSSVFGQAYTSRHLLSFRQLPRHLPDGHFVDLWVSADGTKMMYKEDFTDDRGPGELMVVADGEYLQAETHAGYLAVGWSSPGNAFEVFTQVNAVLGLPAADAEAGFLQLDLVQAEGEQATGTASDVLAYLEEKDPPVTYVRIDYPDGTRVSWSAPAVRLRGATEAFAEVVLRTPQDAATLAVLDVVAGTATSHLRDVQSDAARGIRQFVA